MLSCSIWFSAPNFWMGGGLESRCVGRVYGADGAVCNLRSNAPDDGRMSPKHVELRIHKKITLLHQVSISHYFMRKMHGETTPKRRLLCPDFSYNQLTI